jgi:hypothetical protein
MYKGSNKPNPSALFVGQLLRCIAAINIDDFLSGIVDVGFFRAG